MIAYFAVIFLTGALMADLSSAVVLRFGILKLTGIDVIDYAALILAFIVLASGALHGLSRAGRIYCCLLGWLAVEVALGTSRFGMSALGEFRYIAPLFWFFVPLAMAGLRRIRSHVESATVVTHTIWVAAAAGLLMLLIELANGGRVFLTQQNQDRLAGYTDFRGVRYLDTYQTFNITLAACVLFLRQGSSAATRGKVGRLLLAIVLTLAALWTRNRASLVALFFGFGVLALLERRFRLVLRMALAGIAAVGILALLSTSMMANVTGAFAGVAAPTEDATGQWRLLLQAAALEQALRTPIFGQGYGGYYSFDVPGLGTVLAPPHNQFLEFFMKGGIVALVLACAALVSQGRQLWALRHSSMLSSEERLVVRVLLVLLIAQVPYGLVYDFPPLFGLLIGCGEVIWYRAQRRCLANEAIVNVEFLPAPANV